MQSPAVYDLVVDRPMAEDRVFTSTMLERADWHRGPQVLILANQRHVSDSESSDGDDEARRFPDRVDSNPPMESRKGPIWSRPRRAPSSQTGSLHPSGPLNLINPGALHHSGPLNLINPGPPVGHSGPLKKGVAPKIIPAHLIGKKQSVYDGQEPMSPHVTCLGKVRMRQKDCKATQKVGVEFTLCFKDQAKEKGGEEKKNKLKKHHQKNGPTSQHSSKTIAGLHVNDKDEIGAQLDNDVRYGVGACESDDVGAPARVRGELLAKFMESWDEQTQRFEEETREYVPSVPPANSLLLMRRISRNWEDYLVEDDDDDDSVKNQVHYEPTDKVALPAKHSCLVQSTNAEIAQHEESISGPLFDAELWQRRGIAKPCALSITNPSNNHIVRRIAW